VVEVADPYEDPDEPERRAPARTALVPRFLTALGDRQMGLAEIAKRLGISPKDGTLRRVADDLESGGEIARGLDKKYERCTVPSAIGPKGSGTVAPGTPLSKAENEGAHLNGHNPDLEELAEAEIERLRGKGAA
jgi:hypothetical protein